ncbi:Ig-like protein group 2 [Mobilisporobacter senegalensis]|uniref:Ig-like protein group 2 n=1 Tax=Mobilisporobacter senegalensis TaxID=1329262 RepID=A0A3N1XY04_9FIRM|nr:Ig-like domain-containing protein [Mobilisporobacter senegalensis]ROR31485.1 Ig-like protein group 2 [Mobilisporobacter senegalensis]
MKKNFFKKLAATLAFAMVVTSVAPAATASAAAGITQKNGSTASTVYVTKSYGLKLGKGVNAKWTSSNKSVATVGLTGGVLKPVKPGKVTITAKSTKTGKSYKKTFTVKQRATSVELGDDISLAVGDTAQLDAELTPSTSTDVIRYFSDNKEVATVGMTGGKVTAKANGEATITVYAKATTASSNASTMNKVDTIKVKVGTFIESATQNSDTKLDVTFNTDMKDAKAADFKITADDTKLDIAIKEAKVDGKKVTLETFAEINDGKTYTVTYKDSSYQFTATDNKVASIAITPATVSAETKTEIKVLAKDANGVILSENPYGDVKDSKIEFNIETSNGYTEGSKLYLFKTGDTAKATAKYHTYDYVDGKEVGLLETELTITAVDKSAAGFQEYKYTVAETGKGPSNWSTATLNDKLAVEDTVSRSVYVYLKDNNGDEVTEGYSLSSSNENVLLVNGNGLEASLTAVATGTAYVLVKDVDADKVVLSLPINIVAKRKAASLSLDKNSVTLALNSTPADSATVKATVKDQYGDKIAAGNWGTDNLDPESISNAPDIALAVVSDEIRLNTSYFTGDGAGTYNYNVKFAGLVQNLKVIVKDQAAPTNKSVSYSLGLSDEKIDLLVNDDVTSNKVFTADVKVLRGGVFAQYADIVSYEIKNVSTNKVVASNGAVDLPVGTTSISKTAVTVGAPAVKNLDAGNYSVTLKIAQYKWDGNTLSKDLNTDGSVKTIKLNRSFVVVDTQPKVEVKQVKTTNCDDINDAFEFYYNGKKQDNPGTIIVDEVVSNKTHYIKKVTIDVTEGTTPVRVTVEVNKSFTVK